jgi:1,5-anhydro-D-fructose reductase (1,5-anhydro-D-mannitol-forming)
MLKVVLIGCAHVHTADYLHAIQGESDVRVAAVFDRNMEAAKALAEQIGAAVAANDDDINNLQYDGAIILSETVHHESDIARALRLSCPIFLEKPLAINSATAERIARAVKDSGQLFHTGFFLRTVPAFRQLKQLLKDNHFGRIIEVRFRFAHDGAIGGWLNASSWITDPYRAGYGAFGDLSIHGADLLSWLLDEPIKSGSALTFRSLGLSCDDHGAAVLSFANGISGILESSWIDPLPRLELRFTGLEGTAEIDLENRLIVRKKAQRDLLEDSAMMKPVNLGEVRLNAADGLMPFIRCLRDRQDSADLVPIADALAANNLIDLLYVSQ